MLGTTGKNGIKAALGFSLLAAAGCRVETVSYEEAPPPRHEVYVEEGPPPGETVIIEEAPPEYYEEIPRPREGYVWVRGHQVWYHGHYRWQAGHWERVREGHHWTEGRWENRGHGYIWIEGRWD